MTNPYRSPAAAIQDVYPPSTADTTYQPRIFSSDGRLGRLRYLVYSFIVQLVIMVLIGILAAVAIPLLTSSGNSTAQMLMLAAIYVPFLISMLVMAKRRLNDMNQSGWLSLLMLVPLVNVVMSLVLLFWPGSAGSNAYGPKPEKNSTALVVFGLLLPLMVIGTLAAIAIPAYQDYVKRAQAVQLQQQP